MRFVAVLGMVAGCTPILPFHLAETAETLKRGGVSLTVAGGGGGGAGNGKAIVGCCGGGAVRASFGVGKQMEVGLELAVVGGDPDNHEVYVLSKLRYKVGFGKYLALVAGLGATGAVDTRTSSGVAGLGSDLALVWSTGAIARIVHIYGGARFSFMFALERRDFYGSGGPTQGFIVPVGVSLDATRALRLYLEGGLTGGWSENRGNPGARINLNGWIGGYGLLALSYAWNS